MGDRSYTMPSPQTGAGSARFKSAPTRREFTASLLDSMGAATHTALPFPKVFHTIPGSVPGVSAGGLLWMAPKRLPMGRPCAGGANGRVMVASTSAPGRVMAFSIGPGKLNSFCGQITFSTASSLGERKVHE